MGLGAIEGRGESSLRPDGDTVKERRCKGLVKVCKRQDKQVYEGFEAIKSRNKDMRQGGACLMLTALA